jgi:hypothetical protein
LGSRLYFNFVSITHCRATRDACRQTHHTQTTATQVRRLIIRSDEAHHIHAGCRDLCDRSSCWGGNIIAGLRRAHIFCCACFTKPYGYVPDGRATHAASQSSDSDGNSKVWWSLIDEPSSRCGLCAGVMPDLLQLNPLEGVLHWYLSDMIFRTRTVSIPGSTGVVPPGTDRKCRSGRGARNSGTADS